LILIFELLACSDRRLSSSLQKLSAFGNEKKKKEKRTLFYDY